MATPLSSCARSARRFSAPRSDCDSRTSVNVGPVRSERGDTLIEILIAITVIGLTGVALLGAFASAISASVAYRRTATVGLELKDFAEAATYQIQSTSTSPLYTECAAVGVNASKSQVSYNGAPIAFTLSAGYQFTTATIAFLTGTSFGSCTAGQYQPQMITTTVANTTTGAAQSLSFIVIDPNR